LGSQRRRIRFFIEREQEHSPWMKWLYKLLKVVFIPDIEPLEKNDSCLQQIQALLKKGISVCIFIESWNVYSEVEKLHQSAPFSGILESANYPIIPVQIGKGDGQIKNHWMKILVNKFRVPASIMFGNIIYSGDSGVLESKHEHEYDFDD
jgi:acyl-[acyl-carrier-protein]-phospholipid O-acyltransferase/long-chain-fatty-acid--[acyl-carrier-protein] ligase